MDIRLNQFPPAQKLGHASLDLEIFTTRKRLHRPEGQFGSMALCLDGKSVYVVTDLKRIEKTLDRVQHLQWDMHNAMFDVRQLRRWHTVLPTKPVWDTYIIERLLFSNYFDDFGLEDLARRYLQMSHSKAIREQFSETDQPGVMTEAMIQYNAMDAWLTWHIAEAQAKLLEAEPKIKHVYETIDRPAMFAVLDFKGFTLNVKKWKEVAVMEAARAEAIAAKLGFNPGSAPQTKAALWKARIKVDSTNEKVLTQYQDHPLVQKILEYREAAKRASTYGDNFIAAALEPDGKIYTNYNVVGAETGRMSSSSPINMQTIPARGTKVYRECFTASRGHKLVIADYSQQEPRLAADLSRDPELLKVFASGGDSHLAVAQAIFHDPTLTKADKEQRGRGKTVNLGLLYGLSAYGLALQEKIDPAEAQVMVDNYFRHFRGVKQWIDSTKSRALAVGYVTTLGGRKAHINPHSRQAEKNAINTPVQGSAADNTKRALARLHAHYGAGLPVVAVVHDEIVLDVKAPVREAKVLVQCMTDGFTDIAHTVSTLNLVEVSIGATWADKS